MKVLFGYGVIILVVGYMLSILFHERNCMDTIEYEERKLHQIRKDINTIHRCITGLATAGESVACWQKRRSRSLSQGTAESGQPAF